MENLSRLRMNGFGLSIDDFGTGYSSMERPASKVPFTELKIDQAFVRGIAPSSRAYPLVESALGMAQKLALATVAEGVETAAEAQTLRGSCIATSARAMRSASRCRSTNSSTGCAEQPEPALR